MILRLLDTLDALAQRATIRLDIAVFGYLLFVGIAAVVDALHPNQPRSSGRLIDARAVRGALMAVTGDDPAGRSFPWTRCGTESRRR